MNFAIRWLARPPARRATAFSFGAVAIAVIVGVATAASPASQKRRAADIPQLTWALSAPIRGLDQTHASEGSSVTVIALGCETLVRYDQNGLIKPALANTFSNPNPSTYIYHIRPGVKFWDGTPLTTGDVLYTIKKNRESDAENSSYFAAVKDVSASGDTITITLSKPDPFFRYLMATTFIVEKAFWEAHQKDIGTPGVLTMCTGPFQFTKYVPDSEIDLTAFDGYWGGRPNVRSIALKIIVSDADRYLAMRTGQIDGTFRVPQDQISQWKAVAHTTVTLAPELRTAYLTFNVTKPPFNNVHVRRAFALALDKVGLVKAVLHGYGHVAPAFPPPQEWSAYLSPAKVSQFYETLPQYNFNIRAAKAELKKSPYPNGFKTSIPFPDSQPAMGKVALVLANALKQIGVTLTVHQVPTAAWINSQVHRNFGPLLVGTAGATFPDPADLSHFVYDSTNPYNLAKYKSKAMDGYLAAQRNAASPAARIAAIKKMLTLGAVDVPYVPIWWQDIAMSVNSKYRFTGFGSWYLYQPWALGISAS